MLKRILIPLGFFLSAGLRADPATDEQFAFRRMAAAVLGYDQAPVYSETIENALIQALQKNSRFEFSDAGYVALKEKLKAIPSPSLGDPKGALSRELIESLGSLRAAETDGVILAELIASREGYQIRLALVTTINPEKIRQIQVSASDPSQLESFSLAARTGFTDLLTAIPFAATILSREGDRVILDRGYPFFHQGMVVSVSTMEKQSDGILFQETGTVSITRPEANLSFGRIVAEKGFSLIVAGNKARAAGSVRMSSPFASVTPSDRAPAAILEQQVDQKQNLGFVNLDVGASMLNWTNNASNGTGILSRSGTYMGATLMGQLWITSRWFTDLTLGFGSASLSGSSGTGAVPLNSSSNYVAGQIGFRLDLPVMSRAPSVYVKGGVGRRKLQVDTSVESLFLTSLSYSGLLLGAGAKVPLTDKYGVGADMQTVFFGSLSESPVTSGASTNGVSWWDFCLRGYYIFSPALEFQARLQLLSNSVEFAGRGTRTGGSLASSSQNTRALSVGISYYY